MSLRVPLRSPLSRARTASRGIVRPLVLLAGLLASGCAEPPPPAACRTAGGFASSAPVTAHDTVNVILALPAREDPFELLVRVDALEDEGIVNLTSVPPTTVAAGLALTTSATFSICVSRAPRAVVFQGEAVPRGKAWLQVSTDRPVRTSVRLGGDDGHTLDPALVVVPGRSERRRWASSEVSEDGS